MRKQTFGLSVQAREDVTGDARFLTSVARGMTVLEAFAERPGPMGLTELSRVTGLPIPTLQRLTATLVKACYLEKDEERRSYQLTVRSLDLLYAYLSRNWLARKLWPHLVRLREDLGMDVSVSFPRGRHMIYVHRLPGYRGSFENTLPGRQVPQFASASGRCYLAALSPEACRARIEETDRKKLTPMTRTGAEEILAEIDRCREVGFCLIDQEVSVGVLTLSCPIYRGTDVVAGLSVHHPRASANRDEFTSAVLPSLARVAQALEAR
jgi:DNA-binding IclR family transcriptional regulator